MAIDRIVDFPSKIEAIKLAFEFRMDGYGYFSAVEEETGEAILLGAYGLQNENVPLSDELWNLIESNSEPVDVRRFERRYLKR